MWLGRVRCGGRWDFTDVWYFFFFFLFCFVLFFFFKQKTAYEIVSRDWSSDVCSSDLKFPHVPLKITHDALSPLKSLHSEKEQLKSKLISFTLFDCVFAFSQLKPDSMQNYWPVPIFKVTRCQEMWRAVVYFEQQSHHITSPSINPVQLHVYGYIIVFTLLLIAHWWQLSDYSHQYIRGLRTFAEALRVILFPVRSW